MTLGKLQRHFATKLLPRLLLHIDLLGYEVTLGDAYRDERSHGKYGHILVDANGKRVYGARYSNHKLRLAINLNLFKNGKYLSSGKEFDEIGRYWLSLSNLIPGVKTAWGGPSGDANHFSIWFRNKW